MNFEEWFSQSSEMEMLKPAFELGWNACAADRIGFLEREIELIKEARLEPDEDYEIWRGYYKMAFDSITDGSPGVQKGLLLAALEYLKEQAQIEEEK